MYVSLSDDPNVMLVVTVQGDAVYRIKQFVWLCTLSPFLLIEKHDEKNNFSVWDLLSISLVFIFEKILENKEHRQHQKLQYTKY